jgi:predicted N-acetyltransferase YhbS
MLIRPFTEADLPEAATISAEAFELDITDPEKRRLWEQRVRHCLLTDPDGSFVSESDGLISGLGQAVIREQLWLLSLLTVSPSRGRGGEGRALLNATLEYGHNTTDQAIIIASNDPKALRIYASSGFRLEPTFEVEGPLPDPALIPPIHPDITIVPESELETLAPISRAVRGAEHTIDLRFLASRGATVFRLGDRGFTVAAAGRGVQIVAALDEEAATALLWCALDHLKQEPKIEVSFVTGQQQWALAVFIAARLPFKAYGGVATRGNLGPLYPYIPSPPFA